MNFNDFYPYFLEGYGIHLSWVNGAFYIQGIFQDFERIYYPLLAVISVPLNIVTIVILFRGKCGLSRCVTLYLIAMAMADLLVVILDLILRHIPIVYSDVFIFLEVIDVCNIHAVLLYAASDCSVWFTVTFTFDRWVAIRCQKLKTKYCSEKTAAVVLGIVTVLSCLNNISWYFMYNGNYGLSNHPMFCGIELSDDNLELWAIIEIVHYILTPCLPFFLILLLNIFTVRHIVVSSRARRRLRAQSNGEGPRDVEMENRRKSIVLLFVISGNFILLWAVFAVNAMLERMDNLGYFIYVPEYVLELGFILQLLSCCTNTGIYVVTQNRFRGQFKNLVIYPFSLITHLIKRQD